MPNPKLSMLQDSFTGSSVNTALWNASTAGQYALDPVNNLVSLNVATAANTYNNLGAAGPYDATGSSLYAEITAAPNGNGGTLTTLKLDAGGNNAIQTQVSNTGGFILQVETGGTWSTTALPTYDPNAHRWWMFTESAGQFTFSTSVDGWTWTTLATVSYSWSATAVAVYFQTGTTDTEPSGMAATIRHVNTRVGGAHNQNWPTLEEAWAPYWNCNGGDSPLDRYVDLSDRTRAQTSVNRGRQYELDQVRAGEATLQLANPDGALDPMNTSGPFAGHIMPYQPYRKRAMWPPQRNLLTQVQATGGDLGGQPLGFINAGSGGPAIFTQTDPNHGQFYATPGWQGDTVMQFQVPTSATPGTYVIWTWQTAVEPGTTYTMQIQARNVTASSSCLVYPYIYFWDVVNSAVVGAQSGAVQTLTGATGEGGWTQLTVTGAAPANASYMLIGVILDAAPAATCSIQFDGWQLEKSTTASTWTCPGTWYPVYAGFVERWPSTWDLSGTYGLVQPTAVDAMALLSQRVLRDPFIEEVFSSGPTFFYPFADPQGSTTFADATGAFAAAPEVNGNQGSGTLTAGVSITSANSGGAYIGSSGTVINLNNPNPGTSNGNAATVVSLSSAGVNGPQSTAWTRMIAFRYTGAGGNQPTIWGALGRGTFNPSWIQSSAHLDLGTNNSPIMYLNGAWGFSSANLALSNPVNCADANWHLAMFGYDSNSGNAVIAVDGTVTTSNLGTGLQPTGIIGDYIGAYVTPTNGVAISFPFAGDLAFAAEFPTLLSSSTITTLYQSWKYASQGESSDARYARILRYGGYIGVSSLQSGMTTSMGPATSISGQDVLSALQAVVDTENGEHFADSVGTVTFKARSARYNSLAPVFTFGERADLGERPYEDCQLDHDPTHLANLITLTQDVTNATFSAHDAASQTNYFQRTLTRTLNTSSTLEMQDAAYYLLSRYKNALTRVSAIQLHPAANPALWAVCLQLELGMRIRINRRPPGAQQITVDCFIENIQIQMDDQGDATWLLQCSPVDPTPYGVFASFHTTLADPVSPSASVITINAGADNQNPAAAQIGPGQQLVLGNGTKNKETVTVASVGATSAGWTTATINLQAPTANSHSTGDVVCEPLPTGTTDPTTWDLAAKLDSVAFSY